MSSLSKNSFFNFFSQMTAFLSSLILSILLARMLGPEQMGRYSYWMWLIGTAAMVFSLGVPRALTKFISQYHKEGETRVSQIISRTFIFELKLLVIILALIVYAGFFVEENDRITFLVAGVTIPIAVLNNFLASYLQGLQKYNLLFKVSAILSPVTLAISLIILFFFRSLNNLIALNFFISLISFSISFYYLKGYFNFKAEKITKLIYSEIFKYTMLTSGIVFLDIILMERSEVFFLKYFSSFEQVAFYSIAFGLVNRIMILIPGAISGVIMPRVAQLHGENNLLSISTTYFYSTRYLSLITLPIIFAGANLIDIAILLLYGTSYSPVILIIKILLISGGLSAIVAAASSVLYGIGKQDFILKLAVAAVLVNLALDLVLIPYFGAVGAAYANATAQILGVILGTYYLTQVRKMSFPWRDFFKIVGSCTAASVVVFISRIFTDGYSLTASLISMSLIFMLLYTGCLFLFRFFEKKDFDILEKVADKVPVSIIRNYLTVFLNFLSKKYSYEK